MASGRRKCSMQTKELNPESNGALNASHDGKTPSLCNSRALDTISKWRGGGSKQTGDAHTHHFWRTSKRALLPEPIWSWKGLALPRTPSLAAHATCGVAPEFARPRSRVEAPVDIGFGFSECEWWGKWLGWKICWAREPCRIWVGA
jgi:hypothetical protein